MTKNFLRRLLILIVISIAGSTISHAQQFKVLLFTKTDGYHHESIQEKFNPILSDQAKRLQIIPVSVF